MLENTPRKLLNRILILLCIYTTVHIYSFYIAMLYVSHQLTASLVLHTVVFQFEQNKSFVTLKSSFMIVIFFPQITTKIIKRR